MHGVLLHLDFEDINSQIQIDHPEPLQQNVLDRHLAYPPGFPADARDLVEKLLVFEPTARLGAGSNGFEVCVVLVFVSFFCFVFLFCVCVCVCVALFFSCRLFFLLLPFSCRRLATVTKRPLINTYRL